MPFIHSYSSSRDPSLRTDMRQGLDDRWNGMLFGGRTAAFCRGRRINTFSPRILLGLDSLMCNDQGGKCSIAWLWIFSIEIRESERKVGRSSVFIRVRGLLTLAHHK